MIPVRRRPYDNLSGDLVEATILAHGRRERQAPDERLAKDLPGLDGVALENTPPVGERAAKAWPPERAKEGDGSGL
jgi:hypothetical protein